MRRVLRFVVWGLIDVVALGGVLGALFGYFVYSPAPEVPRLSGTLTKGSIGVGTLKRTYLTYVPQGLAKGSPLVVVMHGSGENGAQMRIETGYGRLRSAVPVAAVWRFVLRSKLLLGFARLRRYRQMCRRRKISNASPRDKTLLPS